MLSNTWQTWAATSFFLVFISTVRSSVNFQLFSWSCTSSVAETGIHVVVLIPFLLEAYQQLYSDILVSYLSYLFTFPKCHLCSHLFCIHFSFVYCYLIIFLFFFFTFFYPSIISIRTKDCLPQLSVFTSSYELVSLNCFQSVGKKEVLSGYNLDDVFLGVNCTLGSTCYID